MIADNICLRSNIGKFHIYRQQNVDLLANNRVFSVISDILQKNSYFCANIINKIVIFPQLVFAKKCCSHIFLQKKALKIYLSNGKIRQAMKIYFPSFPQIVVIQKLFFSCSVCVVIFHHLVAFTEKILNGKLHFLCSGNSELLKETHRVSGIYVGSIPNRCSIKRMQP